ncbi:MAG: bifunctional YncE family protein/alkaline phosphatase family protein [Bryobacteraceae bacterium]|nr:bifunctional YncE family protein/alkaline phosphatase family protein [Bryobacteraceae bacterium]MDW8379396.1 bifunctional YncE family protein/alkaline phosphatase family protein [Bryobacterales bacterium]
MDRRRLLIAALLATLLPAQAAEYRAPAGTRTPLQRGGGQSILPGGRLITPFGKFFKTGPGSFGLAVSPNGKTIVTADGGSRRFSLTVLRALPGGRYQRTSLAPWKADQEPEEEDWRGVFMGLAFEDDRGLYVSEGNSGRVRLLDVRTGRTKHVYDLNQGGFQDSYSGDLVFDPKRSLLFVVDQANYRLVILDTKKKRLLASAKVGRLPFAVALSPEGNRAFVTNIGMFEYQPVPGADRRRARETGLEFPAFGFPSAEARAGATRLNAAGQAVKVPGLGDPNVAESNSLCVINVEDPSNPAVEGFVRTGLPFGGQSLGGSSPSGVVATKDRVYVSNAHNDTVSVVDPIQRRVIEEITIRIPGLENYRGVLPIGLAWHQASNLLFVAEAGINAVGVVDLQTHQVAGHIPAAWFPARLVVDRDQVYVANAKGDGTGPNATTAGPLPESFMMNLRRGALTFFPVPDKNDLKQLTNRVLANNGFLPVREAALAPPKEIRHVVIIVKENRTYDEVFGDIQQASNGAPRGVWDLARFGQTGNVYPRQGSGLQLRFALRSVNVTPNHHLLAARYAFSDNFYADSEVSVDGHHWIVGSYPNAWIESSLRSSGQKDFRLPTKAPGRLQFMESNSSVHPEEQLEAGTLWHHLERHGVSFRNYGEGFELAGVDEGPGLKPTGARLLTNVPMPEPLYRNTARDYPQYNMNIPDQYRATQFIQDVEKRFVKGGEEFPRLIFIHLPNDHIAKPRPEDGYPFEASYVADNDYALGRIIEYLSQTPWWKTMAVFITEDDAQGGVDHIDSHRTVLLVVSPYAKKNYVSRVNTSFPGLLKTVFRILGLPPLNLYDATAADLLDCFTSTPDFTPYVVQPIRPELFDPQQAREPLDPKPSPRMDDPRVLEQQHRQRRP